MKNLDIYRNSYQNTFLSPLKREGRVVWRIVPHVLLCKWVTYKFSASNIQGWKWKFCRKFDNDAYLIQYLFDKFLSTPTSLWAGWGWQCSIRWRGEATTVICSLPVNKFSPCWNSPSWLFVSAVGFLHKTCLFLLRTGWSLCAVAAGSSSVASVRIPWNLSQK